MSEPRSAQRRQQFVFAHGCASSEERNQEQAWHFPLEVLHPAVTESANTTAAVPDRMLSVCSSCSLHVTSRDCHLTWMFQAFTLLRTHTHRGKGTNLVFQSSSDFERFLRAVLCFSSSLFFSSLARSWRNKNTQKYRRYKARTLFHLTQKINKGSNRKCPCKELSTEQQSRAS